MKQRKGKNRFWLVNLLSLVLLISCSPSPTASPSASPLSPLASPQSVGSTAFEPEGWTAGTTGNLDVYFVDIQILEPLAWTDIDWDGEFIWAANNLTQELAVLDETGQTVRTIPFPQIDDLPSNVMGVVSARDKIWIADVAHHAFYALDRQSGEILQQFAYPGTAQGIDWDGATLWVANADGPRLEQWSEQGEMLHSYPARGNWVTGLAWDGHRVWYVDPTVQEIWTLNPASGRQRRQPDFTVLTNQLSFNGIDWAGDRLLLFNDMMGRLYAASK